MPSSPLKRREKDAYLQTLVALLVGVAIEFGSLQPHTQVSHLCHQVQFVSLHVRSVHLFLQPQQSILSYGPTVNEREWVSEWEREPRAATGGQVAAVEQVTWLYHSTLFLWTDVCLIVWYQTVKAAVIFVLDDCMALFNVHVQDLAPWPHIIGLQKPIRFLHTKVCGSSWNIRYGCNVSLW